MTEHQLWAADPHKYGPGKIHIVDPESDDKTMCGRFLSACPGQPTRARAATCMTCMNGVKSREERKEREREWAIQRQQWAAGRRARQEEYQEYLRSPEWRAKRQAVMHRAKGNCEGCHENQAVEVHHLTYENRGNEFLWELVAVCRECHERVHQKHREDDAA